MFSNLMLIMSQLLEIYCTWSIYDPCFYFKVLSNTVTFHKYMSFHFKCSNSIDIHT